MYHRDDESSSSWYLKKIKSNYFLKKSIKKYFVKFNYFLLDLKFSLYQQTVNSEY